jgi:aminoglycoside phosphotransferase (APT) family kinase protein
MATTEQPHDQDRVRQLLRRRPPAAALAWAASAFGPGGRVVSVRPLSSAWLANHVVEVTDAAEVVHRVVLRRWARPGWEEDPDFTAAREAAILDLLAPTPVPAPRLVAADPDAAVCDVPALLLTFLPGGPPDLAADPGRVIEGLAAALPPVHAVEVPFAASGTRVVPDYHRFYDPATLEPPAWSGRPGLWRRAFAVAAGPPPDEGACFIHRDYHPANTLWAGGRLVGVVDWTGGSWGPPSFDLAHMRLNLVWDLGLEVADRFLAAHQALTGADYDPYWDVAAAVDCVPELGPSGGQPEPWLERQEELVALALAGLGGERG